MADFIIFDADKTHLESIYKLAKKEFTYLTPDRSKFESRYSKKPHIVLVAELGEFSGFIEAEFLSPEVARINGIAVLPKYRKKGCASRLMEELMKRFEIIGIQEIQLLVKQRNAAAKSLYKKFGFEFSEKLGRKIDKSTVDIFKLNIEANAVANAN